MAMRNEVKDANVGEVVEERTNMDIRVSDADAEDISQISAGQHHTRRYADEHTMLVMIDTRHPPHNDPPHPASHTTPTFAPPPPPSTPMPYAYSPAPGYPYHPPCTEYPPSYGHGYVARSLTLVAASASDADSCRASALPVAITVRPRKSCRISARSQRHFLYKVTAE